MHIPARLKRYADKQSLIAVMAYFITLTAVTLFYPRLFPTFANSISSSEALRLPGFVFLACVGLYDLKNSGNGIWAFDRTICTTMIGYVVMDLVNSVLTSVQFWLHNIGLHFIPNKCADSYSIAEALYYSWPDMPFDLLSGLFCGVTIVLVNRTILACSRFIARRKA